MVNEKRIKYFSYYGCTDPDRRRDNSPAADSKVDYIISVLNRCGYAVDHISHASSSIPRYLPGYVEQQGENTLRYFASFGRKKSFLRIFNRWFIELQFFLWCLFNLRHGEQIVVYHSLGFDSAFIKLKSIKKIRIIGDIEEIYQDVSPQTHSKEKNEYRFIDICEKYMYPNTVINERINPNGRPFLVCHGIYKENPKVADKFNDGYIHLLYSGTFDPIKGGAVASIQMAEFLPDNYHLHITGFGDDTQVLAEINRVKSIASCKISYHGYLDNRNYLCLMQACTIGLCTQDPTSLLNYTSFPSKILNYMANGLVVLSGRNRVIEESAVSDVIYYYDEQSPKAMAEAVLQIKNVEIEAGEKRLIQLDFQFRDGLINLLKD